MGNLGGKWAEEWSFHNRPYSIDLCMPPLGVLILKLDRQKTEEALQARKLAAQPLED
jgi:1,4-alpha-glucan branching enzyme